MIDDLMIMKKGMLPQSHGLGNIPFIMLFLILQWLVLWFSATSRIFPWSRGNLLNHN